VKAIFKEALVPTLQEPGLRSLVQDSTEDDPNKAECSSGSSLPPAAYEYTRNQDYIKTGCSHLLMGKSCLSGVPPHDEAIAQSNPRRRGLQSTQERYVGVSM